MRDLQHLDVGQLREKMRELARSLEEKSAREETKAVAAEVQQLRRALDDAQRAIEELRGAGKGTPAIGGDIILQINNKFDKIEVRLDCIDQELRDLLKRLQVQKTMDFEEHPSQKSDAATAGLSARLASLEKELRSTQQEMAKAMKELQDQTNEKVDRERLDECERGLFGKLDEVVKALVKQLADKNETKKALKNLEK